MTDDFHQLLILMVVIWTAGKIFRIIKLPIVFGELLGGILVGPALFGIVQADSHMIQTLAELGIFFLMLHSGMHTDPKELFESSKHSFLVAIGGISLPFAGGYALSRFMGETVEVSLFVGMGLSISAIAMAARMFKDCKIEHTRVAHVTLGAAVINDVFALILFSAMLSIGEAGSVDFFSLLWLISKIVLFFLIVFIGGMKTAPVLNRLIYFGNKGFTLTLIIALCMGLIAEAIGLHMIIGAFLAGLFMQQEVIDEKTFDKIEDRVYGLSYSFFGPIFFASLAFHLDFTAIAQAPLFLLLAILLGIAGKLIGCGGMAYVLGMSRLESILVGLSANNRGAVELIIASVGLSKGIISPVIFSILVLMAFATTIFSVLCTGRYARQLRAQSTSRSSSLYPG